MARRIAHFNDPRLEGQVEEFIRHSKMLNETTANLLTGLENHISDNSNPHLVTAEDVGLDSLGRFQISGNLALLNIDEETNVLAQIMMVNLPAYTRLVLERVRYGIISLSDFLSLSVGGAPDVNLWISPDSCNEMLANHILYTNSGEVDLDFEMQIQIKNHEQETDELISAGWWMELAIETLGSSEE